MTRYSPKDLGEDWEFKILRTNTRLFKNPARLRTILEEEKRGGWVLVEKFDDTRIRLKRRAGVKLVEEDFASGYDPYRTQVGPSVGVVQLIFLGMVFGVIMFFMLLSLLR